MVRAKLINIEQTGRKRKLHFNVVLDGDDLKLLDLYLNNHYDDDWSYSDQGSLWVEDMIYAGEYNG